MPCDTRLRSGQSLEERGREIDRALARLEAELQAGKVKVAIASNGAVAFSGWGARDDVSDVCAFRILTTRSSWALRQAVARAESTSGRKVNPQAVAAGVHSHDGGGTWHPGH
jgi:hypothetical protein